MKQYGDDPLIRSMSKDKPKIPGLTTATVIFFLLGIGNLLPWNAFITASAYFFQRFCDTEFVDTFESFFSFTTTICQFITLAALVRWGSDFSLDVKIVYPLGISALCFAICSLFVIIHDISGNTLFAITLLLTAATGMLAAFVQGGTVGIAALFPPSCMNAVMTGQSFSGLTISIMNFIITASATRTGACIDDDESDDSCSYDETSYSALAFFLLATIVLLICILGFKYLEKMQITEHYVTKGAEGDSDIKYGLLDGDVDISNPITNNTAIENNVAIANDGSGGDDADTSNSNSSDLIFQTFKDVIIPAVSVTNCFVVTIGIFPAVLVLFESTQYCDSSLRIWNDLFIPFLFVIYNLGDFSGRNCAGYFRPLFTAENIWILSFSRWAFVPLFIHCNISGVKEPWFASDVFPMIFVFLLGLSNGYTTSLCMMQGPSLVPVTRASLAGNIMLFMLVGGLLGGSLFSFLWVAVAKA